MQLETRVSEAYSEPSQEHLRWRFLYKQLAGETDEEPISLIRTTNQQKNKASLNDTDLVNVEQWTK